MEKEEVHPFEELPEALVEEMLNQSDGIGDSLFHKGGNREAINLYQSFRDPQSSLLIRKEYPFMSIGPISPLSFSGTPLFFTAFDFPDEFSKKNFENKMGKRRTYLPSH